MKSGAASAHNARRLIGVPATMAARAATSRGGQPPARNASESQRPITKSAPRATIRVQRGQQGQARDQVETCRRRAIDQRQTAEPADAKQNAGARALSTQPCSARAGNRRPRPPVRRASGSPPRWAARPARRAQRPARQHLGRPDIGRPVAECSPQRAELFAGSQPQTPLAAAKIEVARTQHDKEQGKGGHRDSANPRRQLETGAGAAGAIGANRLGGPSPRRPHKGRVTVHALAPREGQPCGGCGLRSVRAAVRSMPAWS